MHWLDTYYGRVGDPVPKDFKIDYTPGFNPDKDKIKVQTVTPATESALPVPDARRDIVAAESTKLVKPHVSGYGADLMAVLAHAGLGGQILLMAYVLCYMESAGFTSGPAIKDHNPGNIMFYKGGKKGTWIPSNKTYANRFPDLTRFAVKFRQLMAKAPGRPIDAKTMEDFAHRLKLNNYYGQEAEVSYLGKLMATAQHLGMVPSYKIAMDKTRRAMDANKKIPTWEWVAGGIAAVLILKGLFK